MPLKRKMSATAARRIRRKYTRVTRRKRPMRKYTRGRTGFAKRVKDVILKTAETKFTSVRLTDTNMSEGSGVPTRFIMRHNRIEYFHIFNNTAPDAVKHPIPIQGDSDGQRNGDEIYATGVRIAGSIQMGSVDKHSTYRIFLCEYNDQVYGSGAAIDTYDQTFHNVTGGTNMDTFQHDRIKPKYLRTVKISNSDINDGQDGNVNFKLWHRTGIQQRLRHGYEYLQRVQ
jgi:hypothetical protein